MYRKRTFGMPNVKIKRVSEKMSDIDRERRKKSRRGTEWVKGVNEVGRRRSMLWNLVHKPIMFIFVSQHDA